MNDIIQQAQLHTKECPDHPKWPCSPVCDMLYSVLTTYNNLEHDNARLKDTVDAVLKLCHHSIHFNEKISPLNLKSFVEEHLNAPKVIKVI